MFTEPEKMKARNAVRLAIKNGTLVKPQNCCECGARPRAAKDGRSTLHAHHFQGYDHPLSVVWLCVKCHFKHDKRPSGQGNGRAQLTPEQVEIIRNQYKPDAKWWSPEGSAKALARDFGVSDRTIRRITRGEIWIDAALTPAKVDEAG